MIIARETKVLTSMRIASASMQTEQGKCFRNHSEVKFMDDADDLEAKKCPKYNGLMIKQEIDQVWFCEICDKPHE